MAGSPPIHRIRKRSRGLKQEREEKRNERGMRIHVENRAGRGGSSGTEVGTRSRHKIEYRSNECDFVSTLHLRGGPAAPSRLPRTAAAAKCALVTLFDVEVNFHTREIEATAKGASRRLPPARHVRDACIPLCASLFVSEDEIELEEEGDSTDAEDN
ncbi:hypothetical protein EVAR_51487_1 [Eumeta japonica]|uniref:Uncharacterized protein n=1 Tax=Eumeta variegata TaxID=151549 RepID=A0A4C1XEQ6_EUMVA|nr:hypothetical protein EVAR_51487_1 [Eumeta japonica]